MDTTKPTSQGPRREGSPFALDRDFKAEMAYVVVSVAVLIAFLVSAHLVWAVAWFMLTLFTFGIWRTARGQFK